MDRFFECPPSMIAAAATSLMLTMQGRPAWVRALFVCALCVFFGQKLKLFLVTSV
jgi:hypothetical protein